MKRIVIGALIMACLFTPGFIAIPQTINISSYPSLGNPGSIIGSVSGVVPTKYKMAIVIDVFGTYWSKPTEASPSVAIDSGGYFNAMIRSTDGNDIYAEKIHLFMVPTNSVIPVVLGGGTIPTTLFDLAAATAVVDRAPAANHLVWSGRHWTIKDTYDTVWGPGPNYFSASSVHVDAEDKLHLTVRYVSNHWRCAEIILDDSLGYGSYRFYVDSNLTNLPDPIVFGAFTYDNDIDYHYREIDCIEFNNGLVVGRNAPLQYVIQPYTITDQRHVFVSPSGLGSATHSFLWLPEFVSWNSYSGKQSFVDEYTVGHTIQQNPRPIMDSMFFATSWEDVSSVMMRALYPTNIVVTENPRILWSNPSRLFRTKMTSFYESGANASFEHWSTSSGVPPKGNEKVHINLWLFDGISPGETNQSFEVVLSGFEFRPPTFASRSLQPRLEILKVEDPLGRAPVTLRLTCPGN